MILDENLNVKESGTYEKNSKVNDKMIAKNG